VPPLLLLTRSSKTWRDAVVYDLRGRCVWRGSLDPEANARDLVMLARTVGGPLVVACRKQRDIGILAARAGLEERFWIVAEVGGEPRLLRCCPSPLLVVVLPDRFGHPWEAYDVAPRSLAPLVPEGYAHVFRPIAAERLEDVEAVLEGAAMSVRRLLGPDAWIDVRSPSSVLVPDRGFLEVAPRATIFPRRRAAVVDVARMIAVRRALLGG